MSKLNQLVDSTIRINQSLTEIQSVVAKDFNDQERIEILIELQSLKDKLRSSYYSMMSLSDRGEEAMIVSGII